jgi:hypothetical protein
MRDDLDQIIDRALAGYSGAEPLAGLEQRVLNRVRAEERARKRRWRWALAISVPALAAILVAVLVREPEPALVAKFVPAPVRVSAPPSPARPAVAVQKAPLRRPKPRQVPARVLPKKDMFPTVSPLSSQERLLVGMAESHPNELLTRPVEEIEIKPIQIAPLQIDGGQ